MAKDLALHGLVAIPLAVSGVWLGSRANNG